jgi:hypothetical protein
MSQTLEVSLESPQHGFMSLRLKAAGQSFVTVVSYTPYDSLRDLVEALTSFIDSDCDVLVRWNSEPDEYDFKLSARGDAVSLDVVHYPDHRRSIETGEAVFSFRGTKAGLCLPFWRELRDLQSRAARDEFDRQWRRPFPERELQKLTERVGRLRAPHD